MFVAFLILIGIFVLICSVGVFIVWCIDMWSIEEECEDEEEVKEEDWY